MKAALVAMEAEMEILKNAGNGTFVKMSEKDILDVCVGGYMFEVGEYKVPFDWEAHESGWNSDGAFVLNTGTGWMFRNFELDSCFDECYEGMGLDREMITAEFLSGVHHIDDFYINFVDKDGKECEVGSWKANGDVESPFRLKLNRVLFQDVTTARAYLVKQQVLDSFNRGERLIGLEGVISAAVTRSEGDRDKGPGTRDGMDK